MFKQTLTSVALLTLLLNGQAAAQRADLVAASPAPVTTRAHGVAQSPLPADDDVNAALTTASKWISSVFNLPEPKSLPAVRRVSPQVLALLAPQGSRLDTPDPASPDSGPQPAQGRLVYYDDTTNIIHLASSWTGSTPAEMSTLVHAMARHFQKLGRPKHYDCPEQANELPYDAWARWLGLYDLTLTSEFGTDPGTLLLLTQCVP